MLPASMVNLPSLPHMLKCNSSSNKLSNPVVNNVYAKSIHKKFFCLH